MESTKKVSAFLTDGFETVEALAVIDVLRRAGIEVDTVSITGTRMVKSAQDISVQADRLFEDYDFSTTDVLFLPGGPGHKNYEKSEKLLQLIKEFHENGKRIAAICAAPSVLGHLGILKGKKATCFPGYEKDLYGAEVLTAPVAVITDGNITTGRGMGKSIDLGLELVKLFDEPEKSEEIGRAIQYLEK